MWSRYRGSVGVGHKRVCCTSLDPIVNSRRNNVHPILVIRGSINGGCDPAIVTTTVADRESGAGLPARVALNTRGYNLTGSSVILLRRMHAVSGGHLGRGVNDLSVGSVAGISGTLSIDFKLSVSSANFAAWLGGGITTSRGLFIEQPFLTGYG